MANRTEGITLALDVKGQALVADLRENLDYTHKSLEQLDAAYSSGEIQVAEYLASLGRLSRTAAELSRALADAESRLRDESAASAVAEGRASSLADSLRDAALAARERAAADAALAAADTAMAAANERVNAALAREATEAEETRAALGREMNAMYAADGANEAFIDSAGRVASANGRMGKAASDNAAKQMLFNQGIQAMSYAFQDATSAGGDFWQKLGSTSNNLPQILGMFGLQGKAIAAISTAFSLAIAVGKNWDSLMGQFKDRNPFPEMAESVDTMRRELSNAKEEMEKLEKAGSGTADQIARYNTLRTRTAELETKIADEQDRQARLRRVLESRTEEDEARSKAFETATQGRGGEYLDKITKALRVDSEYHIASEEGRMNRRIAAFNRGEEDPDKRNAFLLEQSKSFQEYAAATRRTDFGKAAEDLMVRLDKGEATAHRILERLATGENGVNFDGLTDRMNAANPMVQAKKKEEEKAEKDRADAAAGEFKTKLGDELDILKAIGGIEKVAEGLTAQAKEKGLAGDKAIVSVKTQLAEAITGALGQRGFAIPDTQKATAAGVIGDLAADAAKAARKKAETGEARAEKQEDKDADRAVNQAVNDFKPDLKPVLGPAAARGVAAGKSTDAVREEVRAMAADALSRGGIVGPTVAAAAARIADELMRDLEADIAARQTTLPRPSPRKPEAPEKPESVNAAGKAPVANAAKPGRAARPRVVRRPARGKPKPGPPAVDPRRRAAAAIADESAAKDPAIKAEAEKIKDTLGKQMQSRFELMMAQNNAAIANGAPVARTAAEDRRLTGAGIAHAVPPEAMASRLQGEMVGVFRSRGAGEQSANLAAKGIADAGNEDLQRRAADFGAQNLTLAQQTLMLTHQLQSEYERLSGIQRQLVAEAKRQGGRASRSNSQKIH